MVKGAIGAKRSKAKTKRETKTFTLDLSVVRKDLILDPSKVETFLQQRIKVDGRVGQLGDRVNVSRSNDKVTIVAETPFSKRYLKYLLKKYLNMQRLRDFLRVVATNKSTYEVKYFKFNPGEEE